MPQTKAFLSDAHCFIERASARWGNEYCTVGNQTKAIEFRCAYVLEWNRKLFNSIPELEWGNGFAVGAVWYVTLF